MRALKRGAAILNPRNLMVRIAVSPWRTRLQIRAAGQPVLGLPALQEGTLQRASKIVVVRLDRLGDAVLFSSFLRELRMKTPKAEIHLVCSPGSLPFYRHCPYVDRIHVFEHEQPVYLALAIHTASRHWELYKAAKAFALEHLAPLHADVLLSPRFEVDSYGATFLAGFSRAKLSISYSEQTTDIRQLVNRGHDKLWSVIIPSAGVAHEVLRNAAFLNQIGVNTGPPTLECWPTAQERNGIDAFLAQHGLRERSVVVAPGASEPRKQWPAERFAAVARALENAGWDVVLIGGASDAEVCSSIVSEVQSPRVKNVCGKLEFGSLFCLLERCSGFVGNDSGPAHLAAAAGIPVVVVSCHPRSGKSDYHQSPERFGPWGVPHRVLQPQNALPACVDHCSALAAHCIRQISADEVSQAILDLLTAGGVTEGAWKAQESTQLCTGVSEKSR